MRKVSDSTVTRLSLYLRILSELNEQGLGTVSSEELARRAGTTASQVRKDLSYFGTFGKRGLGYSVPDLVERLRAILRSEEHTSELQSRENLVCRLLLEKEKQSA